MSCIVWFRRDLRLYDNPALHWACQHHRQVIPVYIHDNRPDQPWAPGSASRWWLACSLQQLERTLRGHGLALVKLSGDPASLLARVARAGQAQQLVFNRLYEPDTLRQDEHISRQLQAQGLRVQSFHSGLLLEPGNILNQQGGPYRVYTPFYRRARALLESRYQDYRPLDADKLLHRVQPVTAAERLSDPLFSVSEPHAWQDKLARHWQPGEKHGQHLLERLLEQSLADYPLQREVPALDGSSRLSAYLHFGEISPQQIFQLLQPLLTGSAGARLADGAEGFLRQLLWREFAHQVLWHFPHSSDRPLDQRYSSGFWRSNKKLLQRWTRGETGVPLVDAGMKQLWETGWMHNRVRMVAASFLTKNLGIHWLQGARWFWETLVDADLANNSMGWQWVAGCGVDAAPYYRIFNPQTQARRFDGESVYIDRWLPHHSQPDYPPPMVDLAASRQRALQRYKQRIS